MENKTFLEKLKFGIGDGNLQYYLYNWKCPSMGAEKVCVPGRGGRGGMCAQAWGPRRYVCPGVGAEEVCVSPPELGLLGRAPVAAEQLVKAEFLCVGPGRPPLL